VSTTLDDLGAAATVRIYEGMGHGVNADEVDEVSAMIARMVE